MKHWYLLSVAGLLCILATACSSEDGPPASANVATSTSNPPAPAATTFVPPSAQPATAPPAATADATRAATQESPGLPTAPAPAPPAPPPVVAAPVAPPATPTLEPPSRPAPVTISMALNLADRAFTPHQVHGNAGDTVALTFIGATEAHTFTVTSLGIDVAIPARETKQFAFVMPVEGEVPFFCRLHGSPTAGMHGLLIFH